MIVEEPYFLKNEKWYYHDEEAWEYKLTSEGKKNKKVVESYNEFYDPKSDDNVIDS